MQMKFCLHIWFPCDDLFKMSLILDILKFISKKLLTGSTEFFLLFGYVVRTTCPCSFAIYRAWFIKFFQIYLDGTCNTAKNNVAFTHMIAVDSIFRWDTIDLNLEEHQQHQWHRYQHGPISTSPTACPFFFRVAPLAPRVSSKQTFAPLH
jgi:hypothetical protein